MGGRTWYKSVGRVDGPMMIWVFDGNDDQEGGRGEGHVERWDGTLGEGGRGPCQIGERVRGMQNLVYRQQRPDGRKGERRRNEGGIYIQAGQMEMGDVVPKDNRVESYKVRMHPTLEEHLLCWRRNEVRR